MTTNFTPADNDSPLLRVLDPAELLAEARLSLQDQPSDCLLLVGGGGTEDASMITRSSLRHLLAEHGQENLVRHLGMMRERGSRQVAAVVVIGDGYQDVLEPVIREVLRRTAVLLRAAARTFRPATLELVTVQGAAAGRRWEVLEGSGQDAGQQGDQQGDLEMTLEDRGSLLAFSDTRAAASAVLVGRQIRQPEPDQRLLADIGRELELPAADLALEADPGELLAAALTALEQLRSRPDGLRERSGMTKCEQIAALLSAVAVDRLHWELLAQCVERGERREISRETLLQILVRDRSWSPHEDVCAGGRWYSGIEQLRRIAAEAMVSTAPAHRATARSAWRGMTALLVILAWWNHRFATAGRFVDELWAQEPESTLAPLLSRMTDTPIFPAWWPSD